jgi:hypothetical protein
MLLLRMLTHLPTRLTDPLGQPFGYVSAAAGFVLLSGYTAGLVYGRLAFQQGLAPMHLWHVDLPLLVVSLCALWGAGWRTLG